MPALSLVALLVVVGAIAFFMRKPAEAPIQVQAAAPATVAAIETKLSETDRAEIDDQYRRAVQFVAASQLTDPPEKSAKACLDAIRRIDPKAQYKAKEIHELVAQIVDQYISMADKSFQQKDKAATQRWLDRAKLFNAGSELIREKERAFGFVAVETR